MIRNLASPARWHILLGNPRRQLLPILLLGCTTNEVSEQPVMINIPALPAAGPPPSLVLITMDTTRADRIGIYGHEKAMTPAIDRLATEGTRFERAYATVPLTIPSHASMMTSLYPTRHGVHNNGDSILPESVLTLAEVLQGEGYQTTASVSAFVTTSAWNLDQGFDQYFDDLQTPKEGQGRWSSERRADSVVDDLETWLSQADSNKPAFIWAHFYDPHDPYLPPKSMAEHFSRRPYDGEIAFMDTQIARLRELVESTFGTDTAWILVADHGEALKGEHGEQTHGLYLFEPTMRIPFIIRSAEALSTPIVISEHAVSNVDVMATGLGLVGVAVPQGLDGVDLSGFNRGETLPRAPVYLEAENVTQRFGFAPEIGVVEGQWKLMDTPNPLLFDLDADPGESTNTLEEHPDRVARLREYAQKIRAADALQGDNVAPELMDELAALGYISHDIQDHGAMSNVDAKDHRQIVKQLEEALRILREGEDPGAAEMLYRTILVDYPTLGEARLGLARSLNYQDRQPEAELVLREAIELQPQSTVLRSNLSNNLAAQSRHQEGLALMESILTQVPEDDMARIGILRMLTDLKRYDEAIAQARQWLEKDPEHHGLQAHLGVALALSGALPDAVPYLADSLADDVPRQLVHRMLAQDAMARGEVDKAIAHLEQATRFFHKDVHAHGELGGLYMSQKRWTDAIGSLTKALDQGPPNPQLRLKLSQAHFNATDYPGAREIHSPLLANLPDDPFVLKLHAELLHKEGHGEEATKVFGKAQAALEAQQKADQKNPTPTP